MTDNPNYPISTASISWLDSAKVFHVRVYSSDGYEIIERCWDGSIWQTGQFKQRGKQVSATCYYDPATGIHIRVFCTGDNKTTEWVCDPVTGWGPGDYTTV